MTRSLYLWFALASLWMGCHRTQRDTAQLLGPPRSEEPFPGLPSASELVRITVVGTNDIHGWVMPHRAQGTPAEQRGNFVEEGGAAVFGGYLSILRNQNPGGVLLLDGGDMFQGNLAANLTEGEVVVEAMNRLGYHAASLGNHEFDYGPVGSVSIATDATQDPFGALKARIAQAHFPLLAANVYQAESGQRPEWLKGDGTLLTTVNGVRVGVLGLVTPTTPRVTNPVNVASLRFTELSEEAEKGARSLRERGAQVVVLVVHAGAKCELRSDPRDLSGCDRTDAELLDLLEALPPRTFDAVVGGHTHSTLAHFVSDTPVIETSGLGRAFGVIELSIDTKSGKVVPSATVIRPPTAICARVESRTGSCDFAARADPSSRWMQATYGGHPVEPNREVAEAIAPALAKVEALQRAPTGLSAPAALGRKYDAESPLGDFLTDSLRSMERADVAIWNSGGLRSDLPAGPIAFGNVYEVLPFDNAVATLMLTRDELRRLMSAAAEAKKGVFQLSGAKMTLKRCEGKQTLVNIRIESRRPKAFYKVVMPDFLARGGDGLGPFLSTLPADRIDLGIRRPANIRDDLIRHWRQAGKPLRAPLAGRIRILEDPADCGGVRSDP